MSPKPPSQPRSRNVALLFTDIADSVVLTRRWGDDAYFRVLQRHNELFRAAIEAQSGGTIVKNTGDGFLARFESPIEATLTALRFQAAIQREPWSPDRIFVRAGIHVGAVMEVHDPDGAPDIVGYSVDIAARAMSLAAGGQILLTRHAFDDARQFIRDHPVPDMGHLSWVAHGPYRFAGADDDPLEIFEVGVPGVSPLAAPRDSPKARRHVAPDEAEMFSWRPALGLAIPRREQWMLERKLGEGGFGEVWVARHARSKTLRVFKFCFDADRLRSFRRELTLFRLLREALGERRDIAHLYEVNLDQPPYSLESEYSPHGDLGAWCDAQGGVAAIPLPQRLNIVISVAEAVAAAHSVGILHKDLKPSNILVDLDPSGNPAPKIADFGIGILTDRSLLEAHRITIAGFTVSQLTENESSRTGTRLYAPPELLSGRRSADGEEKPPPFTAQGDVYALGVLLFQLVVTDFSRPIAAGWERAVDEVIDDPHTRALLKADIAHMVDGDPSRRVQTASEVAERMRSLESRRAAQVEAERARAQREEADRREALAAARRRRMRRIGVGSVAALAALLVVSGVFLLRERALRSEAERQRAVAQSSLNFVEKFLINSPRTEDAGRDARVLDVLGDAAAQIAPQFAAEPLIRAALHSTLAGAYLWLGDLSGAESESRAALGDIGGPGVAAKSDVGQQALLTLSEALWRAERAAEAIEPAESVLRERIHAHGERDPATLEARMMYAHALKHAGRLDEAQNEYAGVQAAYTGAQPPNEEGRLEVQYHLALVQMDRAKALDRNTQAQTIDALNADAADKLEQVYNARASIWSPDDPRTAEAAAVLAQTLSRLGRFDRCDALFESAIATMSRRFGADFWRTCETRCNYATMRVRQKRFEEAVALYELSRQGYRRSVGPDSWRTIDTTRILALVLGRLNRPAEGLRLLSELRAEVGDEAIGPEMLARVVGATNHLEKQLASAATTSAAE